MSPMAQRRGSTNELRQFANVRGESAKHEMVEGRAGQRPDSAAEAIHRA